jgi:hypothetical protein
MPLRRRLLALVLVSSSLLLPGCISRKLIAMELHDAIDAIAEEVCGPRLAVQDTKPPIAKIEFVLQTGLTVGAAPAAGLPIALSGSVQESTKVGVDVKGTTNCRPEAERLRAHKARPLYEYDTATSKLTPLNEPAKVRLQQLAQ